MRFARLGCGIGNGLMAGFAGTAAITLSQSVEMAVRNRPPSQAPAKAVEKVLAIRPAGEAAGRRLSRYVHWGYGTTWGIFRGLLDLLGIHGGAAMASHWTAVQGVAMILLPRLKVVPPVKAWGTKEIALETAHHAVYVGVAGWVYGTWLACPSILHGEKPPLSL
jgi:hypothetical protein